MSDRSPSLATIQSYGTVRSGGISLDGVDTSALEAPLISARTHISDLAETDNPGTVEFDEEQLHAQHPSASQQCAALFQLLLLLKLLLLALLSILGFLFIVAKRDSADGALASSPASQQVAIFFIALAALAPCNVIAVELLEDVVVRHSSERLGVVANVVFEHSAKIFFAFFVLFSARSNALWWISPVMLGCALFHLLLVLGISVVRVHAAEDCMAPSNGISAWTTFSASMPASMAIMMLPTAYSIATSSKSRRTSASNALFISRGVALLVFAVYSLYLWDVLRSGRNNRHYTSVARPNAPPSLSYAVQYRTSVEHYSQQHQHTGMMNGAGAVMAPLSAGMLTARFSSGFALAGATVCLALEACMCYLAVVCLPATAAATGVPMTLFLVVLLPCAFGAASLAAALVMAHVGRLDMAFTVVFSSVTHLFLCVLPVIVLVAWVLGRPLDLVFDPFLVCVCFISAIVAVHLVFASRVRWLEGAILVSVYSLVVCACVLGGGWRLCEA